MQDLCGVRMVPGAQPFIIVNKTNVIEKLHQCKYCYEKESTIVA